MPDLISEISGEIRKERITAPASFADDVLKRITVERRGGLEAMSVSSRIVLFTLVLVVYSSLGVFVGMQSYRNMNAGQSSGVSNAMIELMDTHHLSPDDMHDQLFRHFNSVN